MHINPDVTERVPIVAIFAVARKRRSAITAHHVLWPSIDTAVREGRALGVLVTSRRAERVDRPDDDGVYQMMRRAATSVGISTGSMSW